MKLSKCKACGAEVALNTKKCPYCGARVLHPIFGLVVALILLVAVSPLMFPSLIGHNRANPVAGQSTLAPAPSDTVNSSAEPTDENASIFGPGTYTVGKDITAGTYDCVAVSGFGVIRGEVAAFGTPGFVQTMGVESKTIECAHSYSNLALVDGDVLYIELGLSVDLQAK